MFCDLVDSTGIAGRVDLEDLRDLVRIYQDAAGVSIRRHGGHVANLYGDGVLAYFGYPIAHDDDARRAVMAALDIVRRVVELRNDDLAARIAVHTGSVVVGQMGAGALRVDDAIVGLAPNVAARLQSYAEPNTVIISDATAALVRGYFDLEPLGSFALKGVDRPREAFRPRASLEHVSRFDVAEATGLTPFVGRAADNEFLAHHWSSAVAGTPTTVLLSGDPGIGKTRLVREFRLDPARGEHDFVELRCSALETGRPLHPVADLLRSQLGLTGPGASPERAGRRLRALIERAGLEPQPTLALVGAMLGLPPEDDEPQLAEGVELRREMTLQALRELLVAGVPGRPLLLAVEDLQWADPTTLTLVGSLTASAPRPVMVLCTARPEFESQWLDRPDVHVRALKRLDHTAAEAIVVSIVEGAEIDEPMLRTIVERSDGIPLFIEEIARLVTTHGLDAGERSQAAIPATLHDLLVGRIDRLGEAKPLLQCASVIGRDFSLDLLTAVYEGEPERRRLLERLDATDLVTEIPSLERLTFTFRHALIRDAAYSTLLRAERRSLHERTARALMRAEAGEASIPSASPDVIAYHCAQAGLVAEAIEHYHAAAQLSAASGANAEAVKFVDEGLRLVETMPSGPEQAAAELTLLTARGPALMAQLGYGHPDVSRTFSRAKELCDALGDPIELFPVLYGLAAYSTVRCDLATATDVTGRLLASAAGADDDGLAMLAHAANAQTLFIKGDFARALTHARQCAEHHDPVAQAQYRIIFGEDPALICRGVEAWLLWLTGRPNDAVETMERTLEDSRSLGHQFTLAESLLIAARLWHYMRDVAAVRRAATDALAISSEHGFPLFVANAMVWNGWADAMERGDRSAPERLRQGLDAFRASGAAMFEPHHLVVYGEALAQTGDRPAALRALGEARERAALHGNLDHGVEALRVNALVLAAGDPQDPHVRRLLDEAADLARRQNALSLAVRVAVSELGLAVEIGDANAIEPARSRLAALCDDIPDGARSPELDGARALSRGQALPTTITI